MELSSVYTRPGIFRGSASFTHNGTGLVGQSGSTQNPIGGRPMHDTMPRTFRLGTSTHDASGPMWATSSVGDTRYAENMEGVRAVDRASLGKPAPHGGYHPDRRGVATMETKALSETLKEEAMVKQSIGAYGGRVLGPRYGDDEARKLAIEATARGLDVAGFHTQTSGRYEPLYPVPPSGGLLSREQYQAAFHQAHHPLPPSLERDMLEIHQGAVPVGGDRWAYNQRVGLGNVPRERDMVISHLAW